MPRFYLHLRDAHIDASDEDGQEFADLAAARASALAGIRDIVGHEAIEGKLDLRGRVDIIDETGELLEAIQFKDAFAIVGL